GSAIASQRIAGEADDNVFTLVDKLTMEIKNDLSLPAAARVEQDRPVADVTTHSHEAYRYYLQGVDFSLKWYDEEAEKSYRKALEFDSTFAMAYYRLAYIEWSKGEQEHTKLIAKAVEYSDNVSQKEKHYVKSREAYLSGNYTQYIEELQKIVERYHEEKEAFYYLGFAYMWGLRKHEEAVRYYNKAIEIDPLYKEAYNQLAYTYNEMGNFEKSIWAINEYISLAPDEANPYDSRADLYAYNGKIDQAIESYKKALEIKPDYHWSLGKLGNMYLFKREYAKAESCYKALSSCAEKDWRSWGRTFRACILLYQGKFEEALEVLDDGIAADRMEQAEAVQNAYKHQFKAIIYEEKKNLNLALKEAKISIEIYEKAMRPMEFRWRPFYARLLAESGKIAEAEELARVLKKDNEVKNPDAMFFYWLTLGYIELAKGNPKTASTYLEKTKEVAIYDFGIPFSLARAYLESGRLGEAVTEFEKALSRYDDARVMVPIWAVKAYYLLGLAYERSGWNKKAIEQYEEFLEIWKDADPGIPEVEDAKERLEKLRAESKK
ncbi:MAG: hypothetical protein AMJ89_05460, partial [candidate division Zixibacteria bacterium SM23_73]